ncbi:hypothetical protein PIB30_089374 [Stylosanthes scabra]|uniref:Putative plant transposon protein domain-containing protein n=1 Tax=Stylosanthes scabra TaxID=79078 RepID=A0ABU6SUA6_9FABA|nr:hypothetical protein [Stylosanthes scabra]
MAALLRKRKGKAAASSSGEPPRFKTPYDEAHYKKFFAARDVLAEARMEVDDESLHPIKVQITTRKVIKTRERPLPNVGSYHERTGDNLRLDEVQEYLCEEGGKWVRHANGRPHYLKRNDLTEMARGWYDFVCKSIMPTTNWSEITVDRPVLIHSNMIGEDIRVEEIIADQIYKFVNKKNVRSKLAFPSVITLLCWEAKVKISGDTLIPQESGIDAEAMARVREPREPRQQRQGAPQQPQPQVQQQQDFPPNFYTHFDNSMSMIYRRLDSAQEESRRSFEAINTRMDRMDDQISFLCYSNQMANEQMLFPYQNTARQMKKMEMQGIPMTMANLIIHRQREEEMNQERMRYDQILQEAAAKKAREANKGKAREMEVDSDEEASSESEEW